MRIAHLITGLDVGGAESMLLRLLGASRRPESSFVLCLGPEGRLSPEVSRHVAGLVHLDFARKPWQALREASKVLARWQPDLIQTWLPHADLVGGFLGRYCVRRPVVWSARNSNPGKIGVKLLTRLVYRCCAMLSKRVPCAIVSCATAASESYTDAGYDHRRLIVIPNGFDLSDDTKRAVDRASVRSELGLGDDQTIVVLAARLDPQKDHATFFRAAGLVAKARDDVRFVCCGDGLIPGNSLVMTWLKEADILGRCSLLGRRRDVQRLFNASDIATLTSISEGFPNVLGEAMACGTPCVATDVGDARRIVGDTGIVVPPADPQALAQAWLALLSESLEAHAARGAAARRRIERLYSLSSVVRRYERLYETVMHVRPRRVH